MRVSLTIRVVTGALVLAVLLSALFLLAPGPTAAQAASATLTLAVVLAAMVWWPRENARLPVATVAVSAISLAATVSSVAVRSTAPAAALWILAETAALLLLVMFVVRTAPVPRAAIAGACAALAESVLLLRVAVPTGVVEGALIVGTWCLGSVLATAAGLYLRFLDGRRLRAVAAARRAQRLDLARDLHDFVAHDVSGMVVQAQAARAVGAVDPDAALAALERIEHAGLAALAAMDRTVHMLRDADPHGDPSAAATTSAAQLRAPQGVPDLADLVDRFTAAGPHQARLHLTDDPAEDLPREVSATVYRVAVEALTNVRRHASAATRVDVVVHTETGPDGASVRLTVTDHAPVNPDTSVLAIGGEQRRSGFGLPGLTERVEALGGRLTAGPRATVGWQVDAVLPAGPPPA